MYKSQSPNLTPSNKIRHNEFAEDCEYFKHSSSFLYFLSFNISWKDTAFSKPITLLVHTLLSYGYTNTAYTIVCTWPHFLYMTQWPIYSAYSLLGVQLLRSLTFCIASLWSPCTSEKIYKILYNMKCYTHSNKTHIFILNICVIS